MKITKYYSSNIMRIEFDSLLPSSKVSIRNSLQWRIGDKVFFAIWERFNEIYREA